MSTHDKSTAPKLKDLRVLRDMLSLVDVVVPLHILRANAGPLGLAIAEAWAAQEIAIANDHGGRRMHRMPRWLAPYANASTRRGRR
jgi:hypothetical protein